MTAFGQTYNAAFVIPLSRREHDPAAGERRRRLWSAAVSMGVGAGVMFGVKTATVATTTTFFGGPVLALTALSAGLAAGGIDRWRQCREARAQGLTPPPFDKKRFWAKAATSAGFTLVGGIAFAALGDLLIGGAQAAALPQKDFSQAALTVPVKPNLPALLDEARDVAGGRNGPFAQALRLAEKGKPQAAKDLAFFLFNGQGGAPKNPELAMKLYEYAAQNGNVQARRDLAYIGKRFGAGAFRSVVAAAESAPAPEAVPAPLPPAVTCDISVRGQDVPSSCLLNKDILEPGDRVYFVQRDALTGRVLLDLDVALSSGSRPQSAEDFLDLIALPDAREHFRPVLTAAAAPRVI